jgi:hypothetical protein
VITVSRQLSLGTSAVGVGIAEGQPGDFHTARVKAELAAEIALALSPFGCEIPVPSDVSWFLNPIGIAAYQLSRRQIGRISDRRSSCKR